MFRKITANSGCIKGQQNSGGGWAYGVQCLHGFLVRR